MGDGATMRQHLQKVYEASGEMPLELEHVTFPKGMELIWEYFLSLSNARNSNGYSPNAISYQDIESWNKLTRTQVTPFEVKVIRRLDTVYLNHHAEQQSKRNNKGK